jgi:Putative lumazine-binding
MRTHLVIAFAALTSLLIPSHAAAQPAADTSAHSSVGAQHAVPRPARLPIAAPPQAPAATDDEAAIRHVAELYMSFEPAKLREGFYAQSNLYVAGPQGELRVIPLAQFLENVAKGAAAGRALPKMQIDLVDHAGTAAVVKITERSDEAIVTDYLSMIRSAEGWKVVAKTFYVDHKPQVSANAAPSQTQSASAPPSVSQSSSQSSTPAENPCGPTGEIHVFDYMPGDWTTADAPPPPGGTAFGTSHTEQILDGCAILEHRHIEQNGKMLFNADVIWGYDVVKKQMLLFYVDDHAHTQLYEGRRENGGWSFYRDRPDKDGTIITIRINYAQDGTRFTQTVHRSKDRGATWEPGQSVTTYEPKH